ncbi:MAG: DegT/DnrJ/EryC1/StrS family aminotransferase [Polyangiales bacterium]
MSWKIPLTDVTLGEDEALAAADVVRSGWLSQGERVLAFEREFAQMVGAPHAVAVSNCTVGLELAYLAAGVGPGDEVVLPSLTFVATANAARRLGATVVFADVTSHDDLCVDPAELAARANMRTRAVVLVHYAGWAANVAAARDALREKGLGHVAVIEDCAHAPGAGGRGEDRGARCGALGDLGAFSFFSNKNMTTGEGGMVTTRDDELARALRLLRSHGMSSTTWDRHRGHAFSYDVSRVGTNARMDEVRAAVGRVQLRRLAEANGRRAEVAGWYRDALREHPIDGLAVPFSSGDYGQGAHHIFVALLPEGVDRTRVMASMRDDGVQTSVHYPPTHGFSAYRAHAPRLPRTEAAAPRLLTLPLAPSMSRGDVSAVLDALRRALSTAG